VVGTWEAMRHPGESLGRTVRRIGDDAFAAHIEAALRGRWETGPDAEVSGAAGLTASVA